MLILSNSNVPFKHFGLKFNLSEFIQWTHKIMYGKKKLRFHKIPKSIFSQYKNQIVWLGGRKKKKINNDLIFIV